MTATPAALHFDFTSPSSVVAVLRLDTLRTHGAAITFVGIDMLGLAIAVPFGPRLHTQRDQWANDAQTLGIPLGTPAWQPPTLKAHLVSQIAEQSEVGALWRRHVLHAYWREGAAIDTDEVVLELADNVGLEPQEVTHALADDSRQRTLTQQMTQNRRRGIGDVPVLEVHGNFVSPHVNDADLAALLTV
ncbi:MAG: DsbA family protein [Nitriliruptoraceae bacterium]